MTKEESTRISKNIGCGLFVWMWCISMDYLLLK